MAAATVPFHARCARAADWLAVAFAVSLLWSTSLSVGLSVLWLLAVLPTLRRAAVGSSLILPAAGLPVALFGLAVLGMTWGGASFADQMDNLKVFLKLLAIPILIVQFRHSHRGMFVIGGFLASCTALLGLSYLAWFFPTRWAPWLPEPSWVPVKDYIIQSGEFLICAFGLTQLSITAWREERPAMALAFALLSLAFLCNIIFVVTARSTLVIFAALLPLLALQRFSWRGMLVVLAAGAILAGTAWASSPYLRARVLHIAEEIRQYQTDNEVTSAGLRLELWKKSIRFIAAAPVLGNGIGTTTGLLRAAATGSGASAYVTKQPHNQMFGVAIQLGLLGTVLLFAFWLSHLQLFFGNGLASWLGAGVVVHNVVACLFNSSLFEFTLGWLYLFGVGVLGGMVLRENDPESPGCRNREDAKSATASPPAQPARMNWPQRQ